MEAFKDNTVLRVGPRMGVLPSRKWLLLVVLIFALFPLPSVEGLDVGWTWSENITPQRKYLWNVTQFTIDDHHISEADDPDFPIVEGSIITVTPLARVHGMDYFDIIMQNSTDLPFMLEVDGTVLDDRGNLAVEFIYPNLVIWENGSYSNLFLLDKPQFRDQLQFPEGAEISNDLYIFTLGDYYSTHLIARHIPTGLLVDWYYSFGNGVIHYQFLRSEPVNPDSRQPVPRSQWWMGLILLVPLLMIKRVFSKRVT